MPRGRSGFRLPTRGMWKNTGFRPDAMLPSVSALARHQSVTVISLPHADNACKLYLLLASLSLPAPSDPASVFTLSRRGVPRGRNQIEFDLIAKNKKIPDIPYHHTRGSTAFALVLFCNHKYSCRCASFPQGLFVSLATRDLAACPRTVAAQASSSLHAASTFAM